MSSPLPGEPPPAGPAPSVAPPEPAARGPAALRRIASAIPRGEAVLPLLLGTLLVMIFVAWPLADLGILQRPLFGMMMVLIVLTGLLALGGGGLLAPPAVFLGLLFFALQAVLVATPSPSLVLVADSIALVFLLLLSAVLLRGVMGPDRVQLRRILGAVVVYLLIAILFAVSFDLTERLAPGAFNMGPEPTPSTPLGARFFYLSVITLTSVGFGDMSPIHPVARAVVMAEALMGQLFITILLARLVSFEIEHRRPQGGAGPQDR